MSASVPEPEIRMWHVTAAGDQEAAVKHGLTILAKCGLVFVPKYLGHKGERPEIEECPDCHSAAPSRHADRPHFVYRCYDAADRLIYVGCSVAPKQRMDQHRLTTWWYGQVARTRFTVFPNKEYALYAEAKAIASANPRWNVRHRNREALTLDDYRDLKRALTQNGAGEKRLAKLDAECVERFGETA